MLGVLMVWFERLTSVVLLGMISLHAYPYAVFPHSITYQNISLHSDRPLPVESTDVIRKAAALVQASEITSPERKEHVFVSSERWKAWLFLPSRKSFASSIPLTDFAFVADADIRLNISRSGESDAGPRTLSSVIAHEITHGLIRERIGLVNEIRMPKWIKEGYCDYISRESSFPEDEGRRLLLAGKDNPSKSFEYFVYRQMVRHLIEDRGMRFQDLTAISQDGDSAKAETIAAIRSNPN